METAEVLWTPPDDVLERTRVGDFLGWLGRTRGLSFTTYEELWQWSVTDLAGFWGAVWEYFEVMSDPPPAEVLSDAVMPGARWFPGTALNYAEHVLRMPGVADDEPIVLAYSQTREPVTLTAAELREPNSGAHDENTAPRAAVASMSTYVSGMLGA